MDTQTPNPAPKDLNMLVTELQQVLTAIQSLFILGTHVTLLIRPPLSGSEIILTNDTLKEILDTTSRMWPGVESQRKLQVN